MSDPVPGAAPEDAPEVVLRAALSELRPASRYGLAFQERARAALGALVDARDEWKKKRDESLRRELVAEGQLAEAVVARDTAKRQEKLAWDKFDALNFEILKANLARAKAEASRDEWKTKYETLASSLEEKHADA